MSAQRGSRIPGRPLTTCLQHRQPQTSPICKSWSTAGSADQDVNLRKPCFGHAGPSTWNALLNILKCSTHSLRSKNTFTYRSTSTPSGLEVITVNALYELLTYWLTYPSQPHQAGITLRLDAAVCSCELAASAVADALLGGAGARPAAIRRSSDDAPNTTAGSESTPRTARRPRLPVVGHYTVNRWVPCTQTNNKPPDTNTSSAKWRNTCTSSPNTDQISNYFFHWPTQLQ